MPLSNVFDSVSTVAIYKNGKGDVKTQRVHIKNGKGFKEVMMAKKGRKTRKSRKPLSKKDMECIRKCRFRKGLFADCNVECM